MGKRIDSTDRAKRTGESIRDRNVRVAGDGPLACWNAGYLRACQELTGSVGEARGAPHDDVLFGNVVVLRDDHGRFFRLPIVANSDVGYEPYAGNDILISNSP